jgi:hypothetical protein
VHDDERSAATQQIRLVSHAPFGQHPSPSAASPMPGAPPPSLLSLENGVQEASDPSVARTVMTRLKRR